MKILWEILRKSLWENLVGKSCGKSLWANSYGKILRENLAGQGGGEKANLRKAVIGGIFSIWNSLMGSQPIRIQLGKILQEILAEKSCGKCCGKFPIPISKPFLKVIFKICNSSRSISFSLANVKNSFLKPILDRVFTYDPPN